MIGRHFPVTEHVGIPSFKHHALTPLEPHLLQSHALQLKLLSVLFQLALMMTDVLIGARWIVTMNANLGTVIPLQYQVMSGSEPPKGPKNAYFK